MLAALRLAHLLLLLLLVSLHHEGVHGGHIAPIVLLLEAGVVIRLLVDRAVVGVEEAGCFRHLTTDIVSLLLLSGGGLRQAHL